MLNFCNKLLFFIYFVKMSLNECFEILQNFVLDWLVQDKTALRGLQKNLVGIAKES